jgi:hypothetical protein
LKIQIIADDGEVMETIDDVHVHLKSQYGMGKLLDQMLEVYKHKYMKYMYEQYQRDRRSGEDRRHEDDLDRRK